MDPTRPVDGWRPPWSSFREIFATGADNVDYLTELDHELGSRRQWTRGQWRDRVAGIAADLADRGIRAGDKVAMLAGNSSDALAVTFACWLAVYLQVDAARAFQLGVQPFLAADALKIAVAAAGLPAVWSGIARMRGTR
jgi:acyl-CoA synthetase (AMP-forming)/AMP-acid ligase II